MPALEELRAKVQALFGPKDLALFLKAVAEVAQQNDEVRKAMADMDDISMNFDIPGVVQCHLRLEKGNLTAGDGMLVDARLTIRMEEKTAREVFSGQSDMASAYMAGNITLEGDMGDALKLPALFQAVGPHMARTLFPMMGGA